MGGLMMNKKIAITATVIVSACVASLPSMFPDQEEICTFDANREAERAASAANFPDPVIGSITVNGITSQPGDTTLPLLTPGDIVTITGSGLGNGPDIDFTKIMIGNVRVLETDLKMYQQNFAFEERANFEEPVLHDSWDKNILAWNDGEIQFRVPGHAARGPLKIQIQKLR